MYAKDPSVDDCSEIEIVKDLTTSFPYICVAILVLTFIVETIDLGNSSRFVIASQECDTIRPSCLHCHE